MSTTALEALQKEPNLLDDRSKQLAGIYMTTYQERMRKVDEKFHSGKIKLPNDGEVIYEPQHWIALVLDRCVPDEDLKRFNGHGVTRGQEIERLQALFLILVTSKLEGSWSKLKGSGYIDAYNSGPFLIVSKIDQPLADENGTIQIGCVIVNAHYEPMLESLRNNFPHTTFVTATEFPQWVNQQKTMMQKNEVKFASLNQ